MLLFFPHYILKMLQNLISFYFFMFWFLEVKLILVTISLILWIIRPNLVVPHVFMMNDGCLWVGMHVVPWMFELVKKMFRLRLQRIAMCNVEMIPLSQMFLLERTRLMVDMTVSNFINFPTETLKTFLKFIKLKTIISKLPIDQIEHQLLQLPHFLTNISHFLIHLPRTASFYTWLHQ